MTHLAALALLLAAAKQPSGIEPAVELELRTREDAALVTVIARFARVLAAAEIEQLERTGLRFVRHDGVAARIATFYSVSGTDAALRALADPRATLSARLSAARPTLPPSVVGDDTFEHALRLATEIEARRLTDSAGRHLDGTGIVFADIDGGIDVFHPMLFKADAGYYVWSDVDRNGALTLGIDEVQVEGQESAPLLALGGDVWSSYEDVILFAADAFDPWRQWLYADLDYNRRRDAGREAGFHESTPAYGEPLFYFDDANGNGAADAGERLVRLGTSKLLGVYRVTSGRQYNRGDNLIEMPVYDDLDHATAVTGILVGGDSRFHAIYGIAPAAEVALIDYWYFGNENQAVSTTAAGAAWAERFAPDVFVHEYGSPVWEFGDGTGESEGLVDALAAQGIVQTTACHNFAGYGGHANVNIAAGAATTLPVHFESFTFGDQFYGTYTASLTIRWRTSIVSVTATSPEGVTYDLVPSQTGDASLYVMCFQDISERATSMIGAYLLPRAGGQYVGFDTGFWTLDVTNSGPEAADVDLWVNDDTGYSYFASFRSAGTDLGTMAAPSTADMAISVGASVGNFSNAEQPPLALRYYSGRGPRIDGEQGIDVVAPSDHVSAASGSTVGPGDHRFFEGTSGALPMVAGAIGLLLQAEPTLTPTLVRQRIEAGALADAITGTTPNPEWGYGRLSAYRTIAGADPSPRQAPIAALSLPAQVAPGASVIADASATSDPDDAAADLIYRYDFDYDGAADAEGLGLTAAAFVPAVAGTVWVKLEVLDAAGLRGEALASVAVTSPRRPSGSPDEGCGCVSSSGASWLALLLLAAVRRRR